MRHHKLIINDDSHLWLVPSALTYYWDCFSLFSRPEWSLQCPAIWDLVREVFHYSKQQWLCSNMAVHRALPETPSKLVPFHFRVCESISCEQSKIIVYICRYIPHFANLNNCTKNLSKAKTKQKSPNLCWDARLFFKFE